MWNEVSLGFDNEEETINFGSRKVAVCDSAVYETNTLAIISANVKVRTFKEYFFPQSGRYHIKKYLQEETVNFNHEVPRVTCSKCSNSDAGIIVAINETINVFSSCGDELKNQHSFNGFIDYYVITKNESFVFVILNNGDLHCFIPGSNERSIFLK